MIVRKFFKCEEFNCGGNETMYRIRPCITKESKKDICVTIYIDDRTKNINLDIMCKKDKNFYKNILLNDLLESGIPYKFIYSNKRRIKYTPVMFHNLLEWLNNFVHDETIGF